MNLFDLYENREPYQQAIDKLEARRIEDLENRMDDLCRQRSIPNTTQAHQALKQEFDRLKAERDSYHKIKETHDTTEKDSQGHATGFSHEGDWKKIPKNKAGRPVDPRGEVTHLSDRARREAERAARADVAEGAGEFLYKKLRPSQYGGVDVVGFKEAPRSSVLSGQVLKHFIDSYETEEEALKAHPDAEGYSNNYTDPQVSLSHLPGEDDPVAGGMYPDDIDEQGMSEGAESSPVAGAIVNRIMRQRPDLLTQYGPKLISAAVDEVADYVGDVDEIGSSDVSGWVNQVERMLKENPPEAFAEGGIGQDLVTPQQRIQGATPQKQTPMQKVGSTVKHAANWLAGRGGPGREGPTYEETELDEQEVGPFDIVAGKNLVLLQQAWEKQLPNISLEFPGQNLTVYLPQVYSIFKHLKQMNNNKQVATVQKFFGDRQDFLMWMNSIKQLQIPTKAQKAIKSQFAQPEPGQLDLGIKEAKKKDSLSTPGDPESEVAIKLARSRHPTAKSDLSALVKDKIATDKTVKKEIDQVKADNERQEKEIQSLEKETDALSIATSKASKPKNFDTDGDPTTPVPPSAGAFVPAATTPPVTTATKPAVATPADATTRRTPKSRQISLAEPPMIPPKKSPALSDFELIDFEPTVSKGKEVKDKADTRTMNYRTVPQGRLGRTQRPALAGVGQAPTKDMGKLDVVPQIPSPGLGSSGDSAQLAQVASRSNRQQRFAKPKTVSIVPGNFELVDEGQMNKLDIARQDLELMSERQFYVAYGMSKAAFQQKYRALLKPADPGYTNENIDDDDWEEDEGDYKEDPQAHAQVRKQPLPDSVLRAIEHNPAMRADIIAAYKRKQGITEGPDLLNMSDLQFYKELLAVLVIPIAGLGAAAWHRVQNALKLYRAEDVITALNKKGITVDRATLGQIKPLLLKLEQAIDVDRDGDAAKELARRIQQTVTWGKLKQAPVQPATPVQGHDEPGMVEAIPVIRGTQPTGAQYSNQLAKIAMKLAKQRHADGLRNDAKDFNKAAKLFAAGDVDGGAEIIAYEMDTEPADEFYAYMEHYKIPTEIVFGLNEAGSPAQQAAIAISMKRAGKKPASVDEASNYGSRPQDMLNYDNDELRALRKFVVKKLLPSGVRGSKKTAIRAEYLINSLRTNMGLLDPKFNSREMYKSHTEATERNVRRVRKELYQLLAPYGFQAVEQGVAEGSYAESIQAQGITDPKLLKAAARIDRLAESFK